VTSLQFTDGQLERAAAILRAGPVCDECLGRPFARVGRGFANAERGQALRSATNEPCTEGTCWVCGGAFERAEAWAERAAQLAEGIEYETYLFGVRLSPRLTAVEQVYQERFPTEEGESLKHALNRVIGRAFEARIARDATVAFSGPDLSFLIDVASETIEVHMASLYLYGRYRKLRRGIPQTRWPCRRCRGRGCATCGYTGKQYPESVEEWIAAPLLEVADAAGAHLHGAGREDVDARMLGSGRPFVLELVSPRVRSLDIAQLHERINEHAAGRVEVTPLRRTDRATVALLKESQASKRYRAWVRFDALVLGTQLDEVLSDLLGEIEQRTPRRVAHRRADRIRRRRLLAASSVMNGAESVEAVIDLQGDGGLYIKELISGDDGRTTPSLSERLGVRAVVTSLDVLDVASEGLPDGIRRVDNGESLP